MCYAFQDFENLYLAMEIANGGDLRYHLFKNKVFNEKETSNIIENITFLIFSYSIYRIYCMLFNYWSRIFTFISNIT